MRRFIYPALAAAVLLASAFTFMNEQNWKIGEGYSIQFSGKYASGIFKKLNGSIVFNEQTLSTARFDVTIDVASINTGNGLKNKHAKSEKWFDAEKYPVIRFVSSQVIKTGAGYEAKGELELHGIRKPFTIPFTFIPNGGTGVFKGTFKVNRSDFGISEAKGDESDYTLLEVSVPVTSK